MQFLYPVAAPDPKLVGFGGWLLLLVIKLSLGAVVLIVAGITGTDRVGSILVIGLGCCRHNGLVLLTGNRKRRHYLRKSFLE